VSQHQHFLQYSTFNFQLRRQAGLTMPPNHMAGMEILIENIINIYLIS